MTDSRKQDAWAVVDPRDGRVVGVRQDEDDAQLFASSFGTYKNVIPLFRSPALEQAQPSPEQEREVDALLREFQNACEAVVFASEERTGARQKERAILRNQLRYRLLSVVSPPADTGKET